MLEDLDSNIRTYLPHKTSPPSSKNLTKLNLKSLRTTNANFGAVFIRCWNQGEAPTAKDKLRYFNANALEQLASKTL